MKLNIKSILPKPSIAHFVHSFWHLENNCEQAVPITVLPNGMVDLILSKVQNQPWQMVLRGIDTQPGEASIAAHTSIFAIGFKLLAVEYLFTNSIKDILNQGKPLSKDVWNFSEKDFVDIETFSSKASEIIYSIPKENIDNRKLILFENIYSIEGAFSVKNLSEKSYWSSRQINRYFTETFGIPLKTYCNILRFGASFKHISEGKLFPEENYTDQNHFIKEIKKYAGVTPKALTKNKDERFVNITAAKSLPK